MAIRKIVKIGDDCLRQECRKQEKFDLRLKILLKDITSVERASSMQIGGFAVMRYVLVRYGEGKCAALLPVKEEEFIRLLEQRMSQ